VCIEEVVCYILVFCESTNIHGLWDKHKEALGEDFNRDITNSSTMDQMVLRDIREMLHSMGKDDNEIKKFGLPPIRDVGDRSIDLMREVRGTECLCTPRALGHFLFS
jgi:ATP-dependent DNA helicase PIF1